MNKNTIYALMLGTNLLGGCGSPKEDGSKALYIPAECKDIISLTWESRLWWSLTCKDEKGKEAYYKNAGGNVWERYEILRR